MAKSVGLDIHARGVRAVELSGRGEKFKITRYADLDIESRGGVLDPDALREALTDLFKSGFSKNHVITAIEAHEAVVREIPVPFTNDDQIRKVIKFEAEHHLHNCDADDVVVQYTKVGETAESSNLLVFAVQKEAIARRVESLRASGAEPLAIDLDANAYYHAVHAAGLIAESPDCVLIHVGYRATEIIFVKGGAIRAMRSVRMGVDSIATGLARDMDIDMREADLKMAEIVDDTSGDLFVPTGDTLEVKAETEKSHAELERDMFTTKRAEFVSRLKREFVRSAAALRGGETPERVIAGGPGLRVGGLLDLLGERIGYTIEPFSPSTAFKYRPKNTSTEVFDAGASVAIGLAIKGIGGDSIGMDFRQEELQVANKFELLKNALAVTVTLLFLGLLVFSFYCVIKKKDLRRDRYEKMLTDAYQSFSEVTRKYNDLGDLVPRKVNANDVEAKGERYQAIGRFNRELRIMRRNLDKVTGSTKGIEPIKSALQIWNEIFVAVRKKHEELEFVDFESVEIKQDRVVLNVVLPSGAKADILDGALKEIAFLKAMEAVPGTLTPVRGTDYQRLRYEFKKKKRRRGR